MEHVNLAKVAGDGAAWAMILTPVALGALIWGLPHALDALGWVCGLMRDFAEAVKG